MHSMATDKVDWMKTSKNHFSSTKKNKSTDEKICPQSGLAIKTFSFVYVSCKITNSVSGPFFLFCFSSLETDHHPWKWKQIVYMLYLKVNVQIEIYMSDAKTLFRQTSETIVCECKCFRSLPFQPKRNEEWKPVFR